MPSASLNGIRKSLLAYNALWLDNESKNMRVNNQRVMAIPLKKLK